LEKFCWQACLPLRRLVSSRAVQGGGADSDDDADVRATKIEITENDTGVLAFAANRLPSTTYMEVTLTNAQDVDDDKWDWSTSADGTEWGTELKWQTGSGSSGIYKATVAVADYPNGLYIIGGAGSFLIKVTGIEDSSSGGTSLSTSITELWDDSTQQLLTADQISGYSKLTVTVTNNTESADAWEFTLYSDDTWTTIAWSGKSTDATKSLSIDNLSSYTSGIYINGTWGADSTAYSYTITVTAE
jgi:hypothetical protein